MAIGGPRPRLAPVRPADEAGNGSVTVLMTMSAIAIALTLVLLTELGCVMVMKSHYDNDLNAAREATMESGFQMELKSSDDPGYLVAQKLRDSLRANGYRGSATLAFEEMGGEELSARTSLSGEDELKVRPMAYQIVLSEPYTGVTPAGASWLANAAISTGIECGMCGYGAYGTFSAAGEAGNERSEGCVWTVDCSDDGGWTRLSDDGPQLGTDGMEWARERAAQLAASAVEAD